MSIHYKFRSAREYDTITVDGGFISLFDLKKAIIEAKKLGKSMDLDLEVVNAQTNEAYTDESTLIPKNTSVIVRRVPTTKMASIVQPASAPTHVAVMQERPVEAHPPPQQQYQQYQPPPQQAPVQPQVAPLTVPTESGAPSVGGEEDRIMALINQADDWHATGTTKDTGMTPGGSRGGGGKFTRQYEQKVPPPNYICHRCNQPGHFINQCPTNGDPSFDIPKVKKPTGIPRMYLKPVAGGDSRPSLILPGGQFAVMAANEEVLQREVAKTKQVDTSIPDSLRCPLCGGLLNDAVLIPCCGYSFCEECIRPQYPNDVINCPMCHKTSSASRLVPNLTLRTAVEQFKKSREEMKMNRVIPQRLPEVPRTMPTGPAMPLRSIPTVVSDTPTSVVPLPAVALPVKTEVQPLPSTVSESTTAPATNDPPVEEVQLEGNDSPPYSPSKGLADDASDDKSTRAKSPGSTKDEKEDKDKKENKDDKDPRAADKQYYQNQGQYGYYGGQYQKGVRYCYVCNSPAHQARDCPNRQAIEAAYSAYGYPPYYMDPATAAYYGNAYPGYGYDPRMQGYQDDYRRRRRSRSPRGRSRSPRGRSRSPRGRSPRRSPRRSRSRGRSGDRRRRSPSRDRGTKRKRSTSREDKRDDKSKRSRTDDKDRKDDKSPRDDKSKKDDKDRKDDKAKDDKERASSRDKDKKTDAKQSTTEEVAAPAKMDVDEPKEVEKESTSSKSKPKEDDRKSRDKDRKDSKRDESRKEDKKDDRRDRDDKDRRASDKRDDKERKDDKDRRDTKKEEKKEEKKDDKRPERKDDKPKSDKHDDKKDTKSDRRDDRKDDKPRAEEKEDKSDKRDERKEESRKDDKDKRDDKKDDRRSSDKRDDKRDQKKDDKRDDKKDDRRDKRDERKEDKKDDRRDDRRDSKKDDKKDDRKEESRRDDKRADPKKDERKDDKKSTEKKDEKAAEPKKDEKKEEPSRKRKLDESSGSTGGSVAKKPRLESAVRVVQLSSDREEEPRVKIIPPDHTLKERENKEKRKSIIHEILTGRRDKEDKEKLRKSGEKKDDKKEREVFIEGKKMAVTISPKSERKDKRGEERRDRRR